MDEPSDNLGEWVDLSIDDFASIGQFIMNEDGSVDASFEELCEEDEEGQQVIQIDSSTPSLSIMASSSMRDKYEEKIKILILENETLSKANFEQKELILKYKADEEEIKYKHEVDKKTLEKLMIEVDKTKIVTDQSVNINNAIKRAETAEALVDSLQHELSNIQSTMKAEYELNIEKIIKNNQLLHNKEMSKSESLNNDLISELSEMKQQFNSIQHKFKNNIQHEARMKREIDCLENKLKKSESSYVELLKTLSNAKSENVIESSSNDEVSSIQGCMEGGITFEDRALLGQAIREANRALALVGDDAEESEENGQDNTSASGGSGASASGGGGGGSDLSESVMDVINNDNVSPSDTALSVHKLSEALTKAHQTKIAIERFNVGEVAMFFPIPKKNKNSSIQDYVAFSAKRNKDKHFLANESKELIGKSQHFKEAYVLGRVVHKELLIADESTSHLSLKPGTNYYSVTVSALPFD